MKKGEKKNRKNNNRTKKAIALTFVGGGISIVVTLVLYFTQVFTPEFLGSYWTEHGIRLMSSVEMEKYVEENYAPGRVIKEEIITINDRASGKKYYGNNRSEHKAVRFTIEDKELGFQYTCLSEEEREKGAEIAKYYEKTSCDKRTHKPASER